MLNTAVFAVDSTGKVVGEIAKSCLVVIAVTNDQINTDNLQQQEKNEIEIATDEQKDVTHLLLKFKEYLHTALQKSCNS